jgi:ribosomal protein S19E (S16A)
MAAKPLSAAQVKALEYIERPSQIWVHKGGSIREKVWTQLADMGLIQNEKADARLTEQGRAALNAHKLVEHHRAGDVAKLVELVANGTESEVG